MAIVDLPLAERPVNHSVKPFWPRSPQRSWCVTEDACHVMLLMRTLAWYQGIQAVLRTHLRRHCQIREEQQLENLYADIS